MLFTCMKRAAVLLLLYRKPQKSEIFGVQWVTPLNALLVIFLKKINQFCLTWVKARESKRKGEGGKRQGLLRRRRKGGLCSASKRETNFSFSSPSCTAQPSFSSPCPLSFFLVYLLTFPFPPPLTSG